MLHRSIISQLCIAVATLFLFSPLTAEVTSDEATSSSGRIIKNCKTGGGFGTQRRGCKAVRQPNGDVLGTGCGSAHKGVDYPRSDRSSSPPIYNLRAGTVIFAGWRNDYGNRIVVDEGNGKYTTYSHLKSLAVGKGKRVRAGTILGIMGNTGASNGVHLHLEVINSERFVSPGTAYAKYCN